MKRFFSLMLSVVLLFGLATVGVAPVYAASDYQPSQECIDLLKYFEGFAKYPCWDYLQWTVGYGTVCPDEDLERYQRDGITEEEAEQLLLMHIESFVKLVNSFNDKYDLGMNQYQFDAILLYTYNLGAAWMFRDGPFLTAVTEGYTGNDFLFAISRYCHAGGKVLSPLVRRRLVEANIFFNGDYSRTPPENYSYVIYNMNGGTGETDVQGYDCVVTDVPRVTPTRAGYRFLGWFTAREGGEQVTLLDESTRNKTLYAHWEENGEAPPVEEPDDGVEFPVIVQVTADNVNVRTGPDTDYSVVARVNRGDTLTITEVQTGSGLTWGRFAGGWVALMYTNFDEAVNQQPTDPPVDEPTDPPVDEPAEPPVDEPTDPPVDEPTEPPVDEPTDPPVDEPAEPPVEDPENPPVDEPAEPPADEPVDPPVEDPVDPPVEDPIDPPVEDPVEPPVEDPVDPPVEDPVDPPVEDPIDPPVEDPVDPPVEDPVDPPVEDPVDPPVEDPVDPPVDDPVDPPASVMGTIIGSDLRIRTGPGTSYAVLGFLQKGYRVEIFEQVTVGSMTWGRFELGWICMTYVKLDESVEEPVDPPVEEPVDPPVEEPVEPPVDEPTVPQVLTGTVKVNDLLRIRKGPGTSYTMVGFLYNGTKVEILETEMVDGSLWGRIEKGWICLDYVVLDEVTEPEPEEPEVPEVPDVPEVPEEPEYPRTMTVIADCLRIRSDAGTHNTIVGFLYEGAKVTILEVKEYNGVLWGRVSKGWISMDYVV